MDSGASSNYPFLTLKERDNETGLDYFLARYYSSTQGRFTSPDEFSGGPDELYRFTSPSGVVRDEGFEQGGNLLLLAAGKLRSGLEKSTHLAGGTGSSSLSAVVVVLTAE